MSNYSKLPVDVQREIDEMILKFDENKDGKIEIGELSNIFKDFGIDATSEELSQAAKDLDTNNDGTIDISEVKEFFAGVRLAE
jgi:Ca2+-binding EF-hand superfamily protein